MSMTWLMVMMRMKVIIIMASANQSKHGRKGVQGQLLGGRMLNGFIEAVSLTSFVTFSNFRYFLTLVLQCNGQH